MTTSGAVNMFIQRVIDDQALPFTPRVKSSLDLALEELKSGKVTTSDSLADFKKQMMVLVDSSTSDSGKIWGYSKKNTKGE